MRPRRRIRRAHTCGTSVAFWILVFTVVAATHPNEAGTQELVHQPFTHGENIQPAYDGWERNQDGSYNMLFGYLNRNYREEPDVPIGPNNSFFPGPIDRGQPTHFYPRRQMYVFKVRVPPEWGNSELVWTVTHNGRTDKAVGWLAPFYEVDSLVLRTQRSGGGRPLRDVEKSNKPPSITLAVPDAVSTSVKASVKLAVTVRDDGLPGPGAASRTFREDGTPIQTDSRRRDRSSAPDQAIVNIVAATQTGLAVTWLHYRGTGTVTFDPMVVPLEKSGGRVETTVRFSQPGTYVIRAVADDQLSMVPVDVTVTVQP